MRRLAASLVTSVWCIERKGWLFRHEEVSEICGGAPENGAPQLSLRSYAADFGGAFDCEDVAEPVTHAPPKFQGVENTRFLPALHGFRRLPPSFGDFSPGEQGITRVGY
jgi:hypothetical protein